MQLQQLRHSILNHVFGSVPCSKRRFIVLPGGKNRGSDGRNAVDQRDAQANPKDDSCRLMRPIPLEVLDHLAVSEPWLAPVCARLRELIAADFTSGPLTDDLLRYIAEALPSSKAGPWRALLDRP